MAMPALCRLFEDLGFAGTRSLLQSGNVIFSAGSRAADQVEALLETATEKRFKVSVDFIVRTANEWKKIVARNPFPREAKNDPSHLLVMCLKKAPSDKEIKDLQGSIKGRETIRVDGRNAYTTYSDGIGRSKLTTALIEGKLGTRGTGRNWNTVLKLLELC